MYFFSSIEKSVFTVSANNHAGNVNFPSNALMFYL